MTIYPTSRANASSTKPNCQPPASPSNKTIFLGVIDLGSPHIESAQDVAARIRNGLKHISAERLIAAPDCGMKQLPREVAFGT